MKNFLKRSAVVSAILMLFTALIYVCDIDNLPSNVILFEGETLSLNTIFGIQIETAFSSNPNIEELENNESITVSTNADDLEDIDYTGTINLDVKLLGAKVKEISVNIIENTEVVPIGNLIGVKLYTNGVLVVGMSEISGTDSNKYKPYEGTGIVEGDVIVEIDEKDITSTSELTKQINNSKGNEMRVKYVRKRTSFRSNYECSKNY